MKRGVRVVLFVCTFLIAVSAAYAAEPVTFTKDVAPILYNSCVNCHRPGEVAPMSLISYEDVRPWAKSIQRKVASREMPPWGANPEFGTFKDDRSLSKQQIETIVKWVDAGAPKGDIKDLPALPKFATGWSHGEPDMMVEMPFEFELPAEGEIPVTDFFVKMPVDHDVYVKALEVRPGTPGVVHHAGVFVVEKVPEGAQLVNGRIIGPDGKMMTGNQVNRPNGVSGTEERQQLLSY